MRWQLRGLPQPPSFPFIGHVPYLLKEPWQRMYDFSKKYGSVYAIRVFNKPMIVVADPELVKEMFRDRKDNYIKDQWSYDLMRDVLGWGLVTSEGDVWRAHRTMMMPAFDFRALEALQTVFDQAAKRLTDSIDAARARTKADPLATAAMTTGSAASTAQARLSPEHSGIMTVGDGRRAVVDLSSLYRAVTLEVIAQVALNIKGQDARVFPRLFETVLDECNERILKPYRPWLPWIERPHRKQVDTLDTLVLTAIRARRAERAANGIQAGTPSSAASVTPTNSSSSSSGDASTFKASAADAPEDSIAVRGDKDDHVDARDTARINSIFSKGGDMLTMMLDSSEGAALTDRQLCDEIKTQLMAGHETSSMMLTWATYLLCRHPDAMKKAVAEVDAVLGSVAQPTFREFRNLPYLEQVLYEAMRMFTPVPILNRQAVKEDMLDKYRVPAGTCVMVCISAMHTDPAIWGPDVNEFRPERFSPEERKGRHPWSYIPFSMGGRDCIGRNLALSEAKTVLGTLLQRYTLELAPCHAGDTGHPAADAFVIPLRPRDRLNVVVTPRR